MLRIVGVYRFLILLVPFLAACGGSVLPATTAYPTATAASTEVFASTPTADIYEQNIHLFDYGADAPVQITEKSVDQEAGYTVHDISYPSPKKGDVPAYLVVPEGTGPFAAILLMHGSSGSRSTM